LGHDLVRDPACGAEATNLLEVHVVQLLKEPRLLAFGELRQEVRHSRSLHAPRTTPRAHRELHDCGLANRSFSRRARDGVRPRLDPPCVAHRHTLAPAVLCQKVCPNVIHSGPNMFNINQVPYEATGLKSSISGLFQNHRRPWQTAAFSLSATSPLWIGGDPCTPPGS